MLISKDEFTVGADIHQQCDLFGFVQTGGQNTAQCVRPHEATNVCRRQQHRIRTAGKILHAGENL